MQAPDRHCVYVTGSGLPLDIFEALSLTTAPGDRSSCARPDARALVFVAQDLEADDERRALSRWLSAGAANHGVLSVIAVRPDQEALGQHFAEGRRHVVVLKADPLLIAGAVLRHDPGPAADTQLRIGLGEGESQVDLHPEIELLLRRAFAGFEGLELTELQGGKSDADGVWRVETKAKDRELRSPWVVKGGPIGSISVQVNTFRDVVADRVPFRGCAPLCLERCVSGATRRLSVARFVEGAVRFDDVLKSGDASVAPKVISAIFNGPLNRWRATPSTGQLKLRQQFLDDEESSQYVAKLEARMSSFVAEVGPPVLRPAAIMDILDAMEPVVAPICRVHDDLNIRNVFVTEPAGDVILIDFTRAHKGVLSKDVARLDVGTGWDTELDLAHSISDDVLEGLYAPELFILPLRHFVSGEAAATRLRTIQALRHQLMMEASRANYDPEVEYKVAILMELLYQAKSSGRRASLAYRCAARLAQSLVGTSVSR